MFLLVPYCVIGSASDAELFQPAEGAGQAECGSATSRVVTRLLEPVVPSALCHLLLPLRVHHQGCVCTTQTPTGFLYTSLAEHKYVHHPEHPDLMAAGAGSKPRRTPMSACYHPCITIVLWDSPVVR
eukprot:GHUV01045460.1.p2 GENE.GHUV01045460.1~~GHUV01045460.1.p2  ORF type:complete len:127 (-),score=12.78 GHUV01045460.1:420-800(-)